MDIVSRFGTYHRRGPAAIASRTDRENAPRVAGMVITPGVMCLSGLMTESAFNLVDARGRKYLTAAERKRFLAAVRTHPKPAVQTLAQTLALTGCRVSETLATRACDVDLDAREIRIATLKRRRAAWRAVPVTEHQARIAAAGALEDPRRRATALLAIVLEAVAIGDLTRAREAARRIKDPTRRARAFARIATAEGAS